MCAAHPPPGASRDSQAYDVVMIDGAPGVNDLGRAAIWASDLVPDPGQPSPYDIWAAAETVQLIREARQFRVSLKGAFHHQSQIANTAIGREPRPRWRSLKTCPCLQRPSPTRYLMPRAPRGARRDRGCAEQRGGTSRWASDLPINRQTFVAKRRGRAGPRGDRPMERVATVPNSSHSHIAAALVLPAPPADHRPLFDRQWYRASPPANWPISRAASLFRRKPRSRRARARRSRHR